MLTKSAFTVKFHIKMQRGGLKKVPKSLRGGLTRRFFALRQWKKLLPHTLEKCEKSLRGGLKSRRRTPPPPTSFSNGIVLIDRLQICMIYLDICSGK